MSALSPRASFSGPSSEEVAEDFKDSLGDLAYNNKFEIQNLTLIAKESTEHAQAISRVLENHIKTTPPDRKLPALYVLDSIIKNVGTPYTVYLGRNLYSTFMEMYGLVDAQTRRAMEAVLKTWKDPIAESTDRRPVLPPELVKPIENALFKAKAAISQHAQQLPQMHGRYTATPPQVNSPYMQQGLAQQSQFPPRPVPSPFPAQQARPSSQTGYYQWTPQPQGQHFQPPPAPSLDDVKRDLHYVLQAAEIEAQRNPYDPTLGGRVRALQDLNMVLYNHQCSPTDLQRIASEIRDQQQRLSHTGHPNTPATQWQQQQHVPPSQSQPPSTYSYMPPPQQQSAVNPPSIPPQQLSSLAALFNNGPKPTTPQMRAVAPSLENLPQAQVNAIQDQGAAAVPSNGSDLLAALSKAGIIRSQDAPPLPAQVTQAPPAPPLNPAQVGLADLLKSLNKTSATGPSVFQKSTIDLSYKSSLETFRPELVRKLYPAQSDPCPQCGRRFASTTDGRLKKDLHLDWHFRVNQRIATSAMGRHRNWYVSDVDWIQRREFDESTATATAENTNIDGLTKSASAKSDDIAQPYVRAPAGVTRLTCNICYEEMRSSFPEHIGDWVFLNAAVNNGKIVHASCLAELQQGAPPGRAVRATAKAGESGAAQQQASLAAALAALGGGDRESSRTPDSNLGKRKAEDAVGGPGKLLKGM